MKIDEELIKKVADLARLDLSKEETKSFVKDFKEILDNFSSIDKCDTRGIKPSFQPVKIKNVVRDDKVEESISQEEALSNTEHKKDGYFKGPMAV